MDASMGKGLGELIVAGIIGIIAAIVLFIWLLIDWIFIPTKIKSSKPIVPELYIETNNGVADTTYIYRK